MSERIELKTSDGVSVVGGYYPASTASMKGLLLLHMMPETRQSWHDFAAKARDAGFNVLAVDLRGHGESQGGPDGYRNFSDAEHQLSRRDVEAAAEFLKSKGVSEIYLGGASIGANLALQYLAESGDAKAAFLLSPGLDYRGVRTKQHARALGESKAVYYIASRDDRYSAETIQVLFDETPEGVKKEKKLFEYAGHGTTIFEREPAFMGEIISWFKSV